MSRKRPCGPAPPSWRPPSAACPSLSATPPSSCPAGDVEAVADGVARLLTTRPFGGASADKGREQAKTWPDEDDTARAVVAVYRKLTSPA